MQTTMPRVFMVVLLMGLGFETKPRFETKEQRLGGRRCRS
ncbi:hypothetical protein A33M_2207 [Rhodovulum sp. PH10]|nr:hypothetical protein A33M_2207 [Rhodovulum sp. PH10]